jgi:hypothetical protein
VIDDSGDTTAHPQVMLSPYPQYYDYQLTGLAPGQILFGLDPATPISIRGGAGNNTFTVASPVSYTGITIDGGGMSSLVFDDQATTADETYAVTANTVGRAGSGPISYANMANVALDAGSGRDLLLIQSTAAGTMTDINAGASANAEFVVSNDSVNMDDIQGRLGLHGQKGPGPASLLLFNDSVTLASQTYTLTAGALSRTGIAPITYDGGVEVELITSIYNSAVVNLQSVGADVFTPIALDHAGDTLTIGQPLPKGGSTLASILGPVRIESGYHAGDNPQVILDDSGDTDNASQQIILDKQDDVPGSGTYRIAGMSPASIYLDLGPDASVSLRGGSANKTFAAQNLANVHWSIDGGGGVNTLVGPDAVNTWNITGPNKGTLGSVGFANVQNLVGGHVNDTFVFQTAGSVGGTLDGGGGVNTLDYSADKSDILVDLALHLASQVAGSVSNIANVTGSLGNSLLVGDANANVLQGGAGRNVIIGGAGVDTIRGGGGDNLLIGDATSYDSQIAALEALMKYWDAATSFDSRVTGLKKGVTTSGLFLELNKNTVQNDNVRDDLYGGAGLNWFIADKNDVMNNNNVIGASDRLTRI